MPAKVSNITMTGFRGATSRVEIPFDTSKSITLIFGENGTGKSTIIDAFDFICNQAYGSLESYSLGGQTKKYLASLNCPPSNLKVSIAYGGSTWTATLGREGPIVSPSRGCPDVRILRRKSILGLIEEQPKKRYDALKTFIAVPGIEKSENALREVIRTTDFSYNDAIRALNQANEGLEKLWDDEGKPKGNAINWARNEAEKDLTQLESKVTERANLETAFQDANNELISLDEALTALKTAEESHTATEKIQKETEKKLIQKNAQLLKLLDDARKYIIQKGPLSGCPVCERDTDTLTLMQRLGERINEMQEIAPLITATSKASRDTESKKTISDERRKHLCKNAKILCTLLQSSTLLEVTDLKINWEDFDVLLSYQEPSDDVEQQSRRLLSFIVPLQEPLQLRKDSDQKSIIQHNAIKGHIESLKQKALDAKALETLVAKLKAALDVVSQQRKRYVEEILSSIAAEVEILYTKIHPCEGIGKIRFFLKPNTFGSLEFDGQFYDTSELPPQAYYSESHLDTLGICVFLALSKRFKTENTLIILDDVLTSIDGPHLDRFMSLVHEQTTSFNQIIITTHYRPWRDRYRWAKGPSANAQVIELGPWTLQNGLQTGQFMTAVAELRENLKLSNIDRQAIASKTGIVLESLLDFITLKYRCAIPRNARNEYTLGDLASGIDSKLGKELRIRKSSAQGGTKTDTALKQLIDACTAEQWIRNAVGCHFSAIGSEVTDGDVRKFCESVLALAAELICDSCGMLPMRRPSGSYWQCKCGTLELNPLIYPGADPKTVDDEA